MNGERGDLSARAGQRRAREGGRYRVNFKEPAGRRRYERRTGARLLRKKRLREMVMAVIGRGGWRWCSRLHRKSLRLAAGTSAGTGPRAGGRRLCREHKLARAFPRAE